MLPPAGQLLRDPLAYIAAEHGGQRALCILMENLAGSPAFQRDVATEILRYLREDLADHVRDEEGDLFPVLRQRCLEEDDIELVLGQLNAEHKDEDRLASGLVAGLDDAMRDETPIMDSRLRERLFQYARALRRHLALENGIVLPLARARLTPEDLARLSQAMMNRRKGRSGSGG
jgi:hemerythrin-like domain-containing protein